MGEGKGFGKVILFGEHFVVYGAEAIVSAIDKKTVVNAVESNSGLKINSRVKGSRSFKMAKAVISKMGLEQNVELNVKSDIPSGAGLGSSAALNVATAKALNELFEKNLSLEEISEIAFEGEKVAHGMPSGIDNTIATYGGLLVFKKNLEGGKNFIEKRKLKEPIRIVIGNSGKKSNTKELVVAVRVRKEKNPQWFEKIFVQAKDLIEKAKHSLLHNDLSSLGGLMNENHALLKEIGVSTSELEELVKISLENGAMGAKLTGAGGGGCVLALTPAKEIQERVFGAMNERGFEAYKVSLGV